MSSFKNEKEELLRSYDKTKGDSFMKHAIAQDNFEVVKTMIENGQYPDNNNFMLDILLVGDKKYLEQLEQVWNFAPEKFFIEQNDQGNTVIHILAYDYKNNDLIFKILSKFPTLLNTLNHIKNKSGDSLLMCCIKSSNTEMAKVLVSECGYQDLAQTDQLGRNILMLAVNYLSPLQIQEAFDAEAMKSRVSSDELKDLLNSKDNFNRSVISFAIVEGVPNQTIIYLLYSFKDIISLDSKDFKNMNAFNLAILKENAEIMKAILDVYICPGFYNCITRNSANEYSTPIDKALANLSYDINRYISNLVMNHDSDCGRAQIYSFLNDPLIIDNLARGTKPELEAILLIWNRSSKANFLNVATELGHVPLMVEIFKKARNENQSALECVNLGKEESMKLATEKLLLEPLNYLLDMDTNPTKTFQNAFGNNEKAHGILDDLLHEAAIHDYDTIFTWILASKDKKWLRDCFAKTGDRGTFFHSIAKGNTKSFKLYHDVLKNLEIGNEEQHFMKELFAKKDIDHNTVLHIAAQEPITNQKLKMISDILAKGGIPSMKNKKGETFLKMSPKIPQRLCEHIKSMDDNWYMRVISNIEVLESLIILKDDDIFSTLVKAFTASAEYNLDKVKLVHPITLLHYIYEDKEILENSFHELMMWEAKYHNVELNAVKGCLRRRELDEKEALTIINILQQKIEPSFDLAYCMGKACQSFFIVFFILKFVDFATDITLNINYYEDEFEDFPSKSDCDKMRSPSIICYFHEMHGKILFHTSLFIFVLTYAADMYFVIANHRSNHFFATLAGYCCWNNFMVNTTTSMKMAYLFCWLPLFIVNHIFMYIYGFMMEVFFDYWKPKNDVRLRIPRDTKHQCVYCQLCVCAKEKQNCDCLTCQENENHLVNT